MTIAQLQKKIDIACARLRQGKLIIISDDRDRENEGDLVAAGSLITPKTVNFMIKEARGLVCAPISATLAKHLQLVLMVKKNTEYTKCRFTVSIDYKHGTTTGISAYDRAKTIKALTDGKVGANDFSRPGHIFPLIASGQGLAVRRGQTEASIALLKLAGLPLVAAICEIINDNGTMARKKDLQIFARKHGLLLITVEEIAQYLTT